MFVCVCVVCLTFTLHILFPAAMAVIVCAILLKTPPMYTHIYNEKVDLNC